MDSHHTHTPSVVVQMDVHYWLTNITSKHAEKTNVRFWMTSPMIEFVQKMYADTWVTTTTTMCV